MCTTILIGKKASYDGSTLVARIEDSSAGMFKSKNLLLLNLKINQFITNLFVQIVKLNYLKILCVILVFQM